MIGYRIVEMKNGKPLSLFHGTNKSREIPLDCWHKADSKIVRDGSNGTLYQSGWHFLPSKEEANSFLERMFRVRENRRVIKCYVKDNIRMKAHSKKGGCLLADKIMVKKEDL
jgi:hypothetical protein